MDSEKTRVWIRSEIISLAISSKNNTNNSTKNRRRQFEKSRSISTSTSRNGSYQQINDTSSSSWGWIHAIIISN